MKELCVLAFVELSKCCLKVLIISIVNDLPKQPFTPHFISFLGHLKWPVIELWYQTGRNGEVVSEEGNSRVPSVISGPLLPGSEGCGLGRVGTLGWEGVLYTFPRFQSLIPTDKHTAWPYWDQMKLKFTYKPGLDSLIKITGKRGFQNCATFSFLSQSVIISTGNNDFLKPISSILYTFC